MAQKSAVMGAGALAAGLALAWGGAQRAQAPLESAPSDRQSVAREVMREGAWSLGVLAATFEARERCSPPLSEMGPKGWTADQTRQKTACQLAWRAPSQLDAKAESRIKETLTHAGADPVLYYSAAKAGYQQARPFATSLSSLLTLSLISGWQEAEIQEGRAAPAEAEKIAQEGLAELKEAIARDLATGRKADSLVFLLDPRKAGREQAQLWGVSALKAYWMARRPEAMAAARSVYAPREGPEDDESDFRILQARAKAWAISEVQAIELASRPKKTGWLE